MEAPYAIATLPKPLDGEHGKVWAGQVYGIRGGKKRKRHEVAVGIDGEGVNIYHVQSQSLVQSYAFPPQSYLCAPPCSVSSRLAKGLPADRETYAVVRDGPHDTKRKLVCFSELSTKADTNGSVNGPLRRELRLPEGDVLSLEVLPGEVKHILVSYKDGHVQCVRPDRMTVEWTHARLPVQDSESSTEVEYCTISGVDTAKKGLLRGREDVLAAMGTSSQLLFRVVRTASSRKVQLLTIRTPSQDSITSRRAGLVLVMDYSISQNTKHYASFDLHPTSGTLYQLSHGQLSLHDLSGTSPRLRLELPISDLASTGFCRVSSSLILTITKAAATVYDAQYGSVQASISLTNNSGPDTKGRKRKHNERHGTREAFHPLTAFTDLGLVVGIAGTELVAMQLGQDLRSSKRVRPNGTLLVDVMGKCATLDSGKRSRKTKVNEKRTAKWEAWTTELYVLAQQGDLDALEDFTASTVFTNKDHEQSRKDQGHADEMAARQTAAEPAMEQELALEDLDRGKVLKVLGAVFTSFTAHSSTSTETSPLGVRIRSRRILQWLALSGYLKAEYIQQALRFNPEISTEIAVRPGDVMLAVRTMDSDFQLIRHLLSLPVRWEVEEVVQALKLLIESFDIASDGDSPLALPAAGQDLHGDHAMLNGDADSHADHEAETAEKELDHAATALTSGLEIRSDTLRSVLERLRSYSQRQITKTMQTLMRHKDLIFFLHILRIELADGGWTSHVMQDLNASDPDTRKLLEAGTGEVESPSNQAIRAIAELLNCAVDAIGITGWLVGLSDDSLGTFDLIETVKNEVSAALEGMHEANALVTYLGEMERFDHQVESKMGKAHYGEGIDLPSQGSLPLGGGLGLPNVSGREGKRKERTRLDLARERNMNVGRYSFERIRI